MTGKAVVGPLTGEKLKWMPSEVTTWKQWREKHPETTVLKPPFDLRQYVGTNRHYDQYRRTDRLWFPEGPNPISDKYKRKSNVTIVVRDGKARCYPHAELLEGVNEDGDLEVIKKGVSVRVTDKEGGEIPSMLGFWFAWCAFYPGGTVYERKKG